MNDAGLARSYAFCDDLARREAKNFYYSFRLLPTDRRLAMSALYAFMRTTDDLADESGEVGVKAEHLARRRSDLDRAIRGDAVEWPGFAALADTIERRRIPVKHLHEVIDGVEMDLTRHSYATFDDLYGYCYRVASAVGLCCLSIWGYDSSGGKAEAMAESCGIALQLTNILRDVAEDAKNGRIYIPQEDMKTFGVDAKDLLDPRPSDAVRSLVRFQAKRAYAYYEQAAPLASLVAPIGRPVLGAIAGIYRALLDEIVKREGEILARRISLPKWK